MSIVNKSSLNEIAKRYHLNTEINDKDYDQAFHKYCFNWILEHFTESKTILELGFGEGNFTDYLINSGKSVEIIEGAEMLVEQARAKYQDKVKVHHALFSEFVPKEKFKYILATNILEHVEDPVDVLKCIKKWLAPDGMILITVPNSESIHRRLAVLMGIQPQLDTLSARDHLVGHLRVYNSKSLEKDINLADLRIEHLTGFVLKVLPNSMMKGMSDELLLAMHDISPQLDPTILANLGAVVVHS